MGHILMLMIFWLSIGGGAVCLYSLTMSESMVFLGLWESVIYLLGFFLFSSHLMLLLMTLELVVIKLFLMISLLIFFYTLDPFFIFLYVIITASEAGVGVALLTTFVRGHGNDLILASIS